VEKMTVQLPLGVTHTARYIPPGAGGIGAAGGAWLKAGGGGGASEGHSVMNPPPGAGTVRHCAKAPADPRASTQNAATTVNCLVFISLPPVCSFTATLYTPNRRR
jgi:hypothetical protein